MTQDWGGVQWLDPTADVEMLAELADAWEKEAVIYTDFLPMLRDTLSGAIRITDAKPCIVEDFFHHAHALMQIYVETPLRSHLQRRVAKSSLLQRMERVFSTVGIWSRMEREICLPMGDLSRSPIFTVDCGYKTRTAFHCFQTVDLDAGDNDAVRLAFYAPLARVNVNTRHGLRLDLTAVVNSNPFNAQDNYELEQYHTCIRLLESRHIRVVPITELPYEAEAAGKALNSLIA